jgi:hypothetical protein
VRPQSDSFKRQALKTEGETIGEMSRELDRRHQVRRLAYQLIVQLPEAHNEALAVLDCARDIVLAETTDHHQPLKLRVVDAPVPLLMSATGEPLAIIPPVAMPDGMPRNWRELSMHWLSGAVGGVTALFVMASVAYANDYQSFIDLYAAMFPLTPPS